MEKFVDFNLTLSPGTIKSRLRTDDEALVLDLIETATPLIDPGVVYNICYIEEKQDRAVLVDGKWFKSGVLRKNLDKVGRVFPFVLTIGPVYEKKVDEYQDILTKFYLDEIGNIALTAARKQFEDHLRSKFAYDKISCMAPGSLEDWPIQEQRSLFDLFEGAEKMIGVELTDSMLMLPRKSISGIYFPSETTFFSCQICPRDRCDNRKARYNEELAREYGVLK